MRQPQPQRSRPSAHADLDSHICSRAVTGLAQPSMARPKAELSDSTLAELHSMSIPSLKTILDELWGNWAFRLSLSSNELFHSNVLQYLAEESATEASPDSSRRQSEGAPSATGDDSEEPEVITVEAAKKLLSLLDPHKHELVKATYGKLDASNTLHFVKREWNHMDLVVLERKRKRGGSFTIGRPLFAIEVKVKDYPSADQLLGYRKTLDDRWTQKAKKGEDGTATYPPPLFLLAGDGKEALEDERLKATPTFGLDFGGLAKALQEWASGDTTSSPVLREYVSLCNALHDLLQKLRVKLKDDLTWTTAEEMGELLRPYRLHSLWWKLWAAHVRRTCAKKIIDAWVGNEADLKNPLHCYSGFTSTGNLGICWHWQTPPEEPGKRVKPEQAISIGVQIEGKSFRLFLNVVYGDLGDKSKARLDTEAALLRLLLSHGVFASNPAMDTLQERWKVVPKVKNKEIPYRNAKTWEGLLSCSGQIASPKKSKLFASVSPGKGDPVGETMPMLPGYANAPGNGFADIRLSLEDESKVNEVAELVCRILVDNELSAPSTSANRELLLLRVVKGFSEAEDKKGWLSQPKLAEV